MTPWKALRAYLRRSEAGVIFLGTPPNPEVPEPSQPLQPCTPEEAEALRLKKEGETLLKRIENQDFRAPLKQDVYNEETEKWETEEIEVFDRCAYEMAISQYLGFVWGGKESSRCSQERYHYSGISLRGPKPTQPFKIGGLESKPGKLIIRKRSGLNECERLAVDVAKLLKLKLPKQLRKRSEGKLYGYTDYRMILPLGSRSNFTYDAAKREFTFPNEIA